MSTNNSTNDQSKNAVRPGTGSRESVASKQLVRPWAKAVVEEEADGLVMTEAEIKAMEARLGHKLDV